MQATQTDKLLNHLARGKRTTRIEALFDFHIQNITARITDLRNSGIDVKHLMKRDPNGGRYAEYFLTAGEVEHALNSGRIYRNPNSNNYEVA